MRLRLRLVLTETDAEAAPALRRMNRDLLERARELVRCGVFSHPLAIIAAHGQAPAGLRVD